MATVMEPRAAETGATPRGSMAELSYSQMNVLLDCGEKFRLSYGHRLGLFEERVPREPQGSFLGGITIHEQIEVAEREEDWPDRTRFAAGGKALERFHRALDAKLSDQWFPCPDCAETGEVPDLASDTMVVCPRCDGERTLRGEAAVRWGGRGQGENLAWWHKQGEFMLRRYQETRTDLDRQGFRVVPDGIEMKVVAELPSCVLCNGRAGAHQADDHEFTPRRVVAYLDAFLALDAGATAADSIEYVDRGTAEILTGKPVVVDYKTGQVGRAGPFQPATYAWMVENAGPGVVVDDGLMIYLRAADEAKRLQWYDLRSLKPRVPETYDAIARMQETGLFIPNPDGWHDSCSVRHACSYYAALQSAKDHGGEEV